MSSRDPQYDVLRLHLDDLARSVRAGDEGRRTLFDALRALAATVRRAA